MKIVVMLIGLVFVLWGRDIVVFENEFKVFTADKSFNQVVVGNQELLKVTVMETSSKSDQTLRLFGKKSGNTSLLIHYNDNTIENYQIYVNQNLGFVQKMVNIVAPQVTLHRAGDGSTVLGGIFSDPHQKRRVFQLLANAGIDVNQTMDLSETKTVEKMVRTKLYLVSIDNNRAEELGGAVGLNYFGKNGDISLNAMSKTYATFSGFLLDQTGAFANSGKSLVANLSFLKSKGVAKILDDTVLLGTEDQNSSFHVGGQIFVPISLTYNNNSNFPTINAKEKEYGLRLTIRPKFLEKEGYMGIMVAINDSEFDSDPTHQVMLGENVYIPAFRSKNITTDVVAQSGQVIALGGRLHTETNKQEEKIPFLGDIPILGHLFKRTVDANRANDLLFFLVPEIVDGNEYVDESGFYKSFKKSSTQLHEQLTEVESDEKKGSSDQTSSIEPSSEENTTNVLQNTAGNAVVLDFSSAVKEQNTTVNETIQIPNQEIIKAGAVDKSVPEAMKTNESYYEVTSAYIYLRAKPKVGKPMNVWKKGHKLQIGDEIAIENVLWAKIIKDCSKEGCENVIGPLWISKNHIKEISQI
ncbi:MAG: pilus assembly protein N-terminal domain-containing protein [Sulfuricurvum sp.]|nr:pilus assembly protein N-terminal domain-containing protein [Sulfuricurvum sp.]